MKRFFSMAVLGLALTAGVSSAAGAFVRFGPPPPVREVVVVRPGPHHVWVPGYHKWTRGRYVWVKGHWAKPPRHRTVWVPGYWTPRDHGYIWVAGHWR